MSVDVLTEVLIERPLREVAAYAGDPDKAPELRNRREPRGFSKIAVPFMSAAMRRANRNDLARLKALLESEEPSP